MQRVVGRLCVFVGLGPSAFVVRLPCLFVESPSDRWQRLGVLLSASTHEKISLLQSKINLLKMIGDLSRLKLRTGPFFRPSNMLLMFNCAPERLRRRLESICSSEIICTQRMRRPIECHSRHLHQG